MTKRVGRPKQMPPIEKQISIEQAKKLVDEIRSKRGRKPIAIGTIYNKLHALELHSWPDKSDRRFVVLDEDEVREKLCG